MASSAPRGLRSDHVVTVGIALFSMLFGAGNLIIPPLLALQAGSATPVAMLGFLVAAIGLPVMGFIAVELAGTARELAGRVHPKFGEFFVAAVYLAIGPCLAIPRTSSTAFEMLVPLLPEGVSRGTARLVFAIGFFVVACVLTLRPGVITRVLGRITGPALIALIVLVVGAAVISPLGPAAAPQAPYNAGAAVQGFLTGYQTMDLLASLAFGIIVARCDRRRAHGHHLLRLGPCRYAARHRDARRYQRRRHPRPFGLHAFWACRHGRGLCDLFPRLHERVHRPYQLLLAIFLRNVCGRWGSGGLRGGHAPPLCGSRLCVRSVFVRAN